MLGPTPMRALDLDLAELRVREVLRRMWEAGPPAVQELFCAELGYHRADEVLGVDGWPDQVRSFLGGPAMVLAQQKGEAGSFDVVYVPLVPARPTQPDQKPRLAERSIINQLLRVHPHALFVFSEPDSQEIHLVHVRHGANTARRSVLRRITVNRNGRLDATAALVARLALSSVPQVGSQPCASAMQSHHDEVYDVEAASNDFVKSCVGIFERLLLDLQKEAGSAGEVYDSALRFLSRFVVLYFLQAEGWLGGDSQFIVGLWQAYCESKNQGDTFVRDWLGPLFSQVFTGRRGADAGAWQDLPPATRDALAQAPRLGPVLRWQVEWAGLELPPVSDGRFGELLGLMEAQRYVIRESAPLDREVALDPAIVGLLQENLAVLSQQIAAGKASDARRSRGVFYTPRVETDLMCRLSLVDWLGNHLGTEERSLLYRAVFALGACEKQQADQQLAARKLWSPLRALLQDVQVLDPACGAGAFLVGMLSILDDLLLRAATQLGVQETATERKRRIIEQSLFGVDVTDEAVEAAMLRLCLQLVSEAVDTRDRGWLASGLGGLAPNVQCGDSLIREMHGIIPRPQAAGVQHSTQRAPPADERRSPETTSSLPSTFDIIIGNPPYVRQELIRDPVGACSSEGGAGGHQYKSRISQSAYKAWPRTFGYDPVQDLARWRLQARSDLYVYFYLQGLSRLKPQGTLCFLTSNAWLDARYGRELRKFLLTRGEVRLVVGNTVQRSFFDAEVNTVIGLLGPATDAEAERPESLEHVARYLTLTIPFDQALCAEIWEQVQETWGYHATPEWRIWSLRQADLLHDGGGEQGQHTPGDKWGGQYLRAPHIYWLLVDRYGEKLRRIGDIAEVRRGITTGANGFFFLDEDSLAEWGIEAEYLARILKSPRGHESVWLEADRDRLGYVFVCHSEPDELQGTRALDYIRHGEALGYHLRPTCMSRRRWYDLGQRSGASVHCNYLVDQVMRFYASERSLLASDSFQEIHCAVEPALVAAACNSAICQLSANVFGRSNFGGGLLKVQTYEVRDLLIPDPALLGQQVGAAFRCAGLLGLDGMDRRRLDSMIFDLLGLSGGERAAVQEALSDMVSKRLAKARRSPGAEAAGSLGGR